MTTPKMEPDIQKTESPVEPAPDSNAAPAPQVEETAPPPPVAPIEEEEEEKRRRWLLLLLLLLLICCCCIGSLFVRYIMQPQPLPQIILPPQVAGCFEPIYQFSINGVDGPVAVAVSPNNQRIYVAESKGERLVKVFDRDGNLLTSFAPPGTDKANREPKYMAIDPFTERVYLVDRTSNAIDIYDAEGVFVDAIIGRQLTLSKYLASQQSGAVLAGVTILHYEGINEILTYRLPDGQVKSEKITFSEDDRPWSPLGLRFDSEGNLLYSDKSVGMHSINVIPASALSGDLSAFAPEIKGFGTEGSGNAEFSFPQVAVVDEDGNFYVSDGNNARIVVWTPDMNYKTFFAFGSALNGGLNMPRGVWLTNRCLVVADAVASLIRVYDVSGDEPSLAFELGGYGFAEGLFSYPIDVFVDGTGRLYVADRENNRIQVWSY